MLKKMSVKTILFFIGIIFFTVGTVFIVTGGFVHMSNASFMKNADTTYAEITDIEHDYNYRNGKKKKDYDVWIEYTVDGIIYNQRLNSYDSSMYVGKEIEVYYDPENPSDVRTNSKIFEIIIMSMGGFFAVSGGTFLAVVIVKNNKVKNLRKNGEVFTGTITDVKINRNVRINGRHPYKAECEVINPYDGEKYLYSSKNINSDISHFIGMTVNVYVDKNKKSKYYVDMDELMERYNTENKIHDYR